MRVCLLIPSLDAGGAERQFVLTANGLAARGHAVCAALFRRRGPLLADLAPEVEVHDLRKGGKADVAGFLWRTARFLRGRRPDVLYSFLGVPNIVSALLGPLLPGTAAVWSLRASDMDLSRYSRLARWCWAAERRLSRRARLVLANSETGRRYALANGFPADRLRVVPNGIDTDRFRPDRARGTAFRAGLGCGPEHILVGLVARLDPMKDHATFLAAARLAADRDPALRFVCVGEGGLGPALRRRAADLGLDGRLTWTGFQADMPTVYNALDVACLTSRTEGFPNVLGEAMSCGVPCVATDAGDSADILGGLGTVVPRGDPAALAAALADTAAGVRAGQVPDTRPRIVDGFSLARMLERTEALLREAARA
ncbi:MAG: glycosyltransferase [Desulfovibrionaceae bacterium]